MPIIITSFCYSNRTICPSVRKKSNIRGINIGQQEHKLELNANDVILLITKPINTLSEPQKEILKYGRLPGFTINYKTSRYW